MRTAITIGVIQYCFNSGSGGAMVYLLGLVLLLAFVQDVLWTLDKCFPGGK